MDSELNVAEKVPSLEPKMKARRKGKNALDANSASRLDMPKVNTYDLNALRMEDEGKEGRARGDT